MAHLRFRCSNCEKVLQIDDVYAGQNIQCPSCNTVVEAPAKNSSSTTKPVERRKSDPKRTTPPSHRPTDRERANKTRDEFAAAPLPKASYPKKSDPSWQSYQPEYAGPATAPPILPIVLVVVCAALTLMGLGIYFGAKMYLAQAEKRAVENTESQVSRTNARLDDSHNNANAKSDALPVSETEKATFPLSPTSKPTLSEQNATTLPLAVPAFPALDSGRSISGIRLYEIQLRTANTSTDPGFRTRMRIYMPESATEPHSIPCVLVAPAGTPLLHGCNIEDSSYHKETLPYARAGMAVVHYSIDGWLSPAAASGSNVQHMKAIAASFKEFLSAEAGITNGRVALEFALAKLPQVDPTKIYCAGHSSAATLALQLAASEPRIAKCAAYAPMCDLRTRLSELLIDPDAEAMFSGVREYVNAKSPTRLIPRFHCPVFIFHSQDDNNEPWETSNQFCNAMKAAGKDCTLESIPTGDHFQSMIDVGIPKGIEWFKK